MGHAGFLTHIVLTLSHYLQTFMNDRPSDLSQCCHNIIPSADPQKVGNVFVGVGLSRLRKLALQMPSCRCPRSAVAHSLCGEGHQQESCHERLAPKACRGEGGRPWQSEQKHFEVWDVCSSVCCVFPGPADSHKISSPPALVDHRDSGMFAFLNFTVFIRLERYQNWSSFVEFTAPNVWVRCEQF